MYFPIGWPKELSIPEQDQSCIHKVVCNRDKILFAILTDNTLYIWFCKPCVPIVFHQRLPESVTSIGKNALVEWRPDSSMLVVATEKGYLLFYKLGVIAEQKGLYEQVDSPNPNLRRDSAELFIKEVVPPLHLSLERETPVEGQISSVVCLRDELMIPSTCGHVFRYRWDGSLHRDYCLDLRRVPFCIDQQVSKAVPLQEEGTYVSDIEYSPLVGGFAIVLSDGRAAFLTAASLRFDPNQVQGIWAQNIDDATCASVNHKYRLIVFGRMNSQCVVFGVDDASGALEVSHRTVLASRDYVGLVGAVCCVRWTPDGCAMAVTWAHGGFSLWSTFGALLTCSLGWDYGLHVDLHRSNPLTCHSMEWSAEGYQLWMVNRQPVGESETSKTKDANANTSGSACVSFRDSVLQLDFVKSALTVNPCMSHQGHLYLQGEDRLYVNLGESWGRVYQEGTMQPLQRGEAQNAGMLMGNKQWTVVQIPSAYLSTNWPIRYTAIDAEGQNVAVAGRTGLAHYSLTTRRWKLFGNESQEKDFVVTGGLLWWRSHLVLGCYSLVDHRDELRVYPRDSRLDNAFLQTVRLQEQVLLLNRLRDRFVIFCATGSVHVYSLRLTENSPGTLSAQHLQIMDASALCVHPACVVSVALTALRTETGRGTSPRDAAPESLMLNVSGRLLLVQRDGIVDGSRTDVDLFQCAPPTALASCVENVWVPRKPRREKPHLTEALWLFCGAHGMRVWLPLFPRDAPDRAHTFMSKRIMLPFQLSIYPLAILFEDAILLGAENDTMLYTSDASSPFSLPFCVLEKTSQVYLHQILRQLIRRNLGFHAWEIARSCTGLPYFPHSLELLLHEVLEEEATSKEPIPDALLPSVVAFIQEFPVYLQTVVQCARKTEIALWPYLFSAAGKPKDLFQECLASQQLDTAASYLIILQNLEPSSVSRQYATLLLDASLDNCRWELSKDLVRFLRAIDPNDVESPRASFILPSKYGVNSQTPPVSPNEEDLSLVLGTMQVSRGRSFSTTASPKVPTPGETGAVGSGPAGTSAATCSVGASTSDGSKSVPLRRKKSLPTGRGDVREPSGSAEEFFIDVILQRHARRLLSARRLQDLGRFAAHLDFHLVAWLKRERDRAAQVDCFVSALKALHTDFEWPYPALQHPLAFYLQSKSADGSPTSPSTEALSVDVAAGDSSLGVESSGYRSSAGADPTSPRGKLLFMHPYGGPSLESPLGMRNAEPLVSAVVEAHLTPHLLQDERSLLSEESSLWGEELGESVASEAPSLLWQEQVPSTTVLEKLSQELSAKGSLRAEVQLRYLLQLFSEAGCMEWALVVSVLLRDAMAVLRTTTAGRAPHFSTEALTRLRDGFVALAHWSASECLGYQPFMAAVQGQAALLAKAVATRQRQERQASISSLPPPSRPLSNTTATAVTSTAVTNPTASVPLSSPGTPSRSPAPVAAPATASRRTSAVSGPSSRPASLGDNSGVNTRRRASIPFGAGSNAVDSVAVSEGGGGGRHEGENEVEAGASGGCTVS